MVKAFSHGQVATLMKAIGDLMPVTARVSSGGLMATDTKATL